MFFQLMPLHWGEVVKNTQVFNVDPMGRTIPTVKGLGVEQTITAQGIAHKTSASGAAKSLRGRGRAVRLSGKGKIC